MRLSLAIVFAAGFIGWLNTPAIDYDEALYAQMAREMHSTAEWLQPIWDARPLYDKPATFIWSLLPFVSFDAQADGHSGIFRLGNLLASLFVALGCRRLIQQTLGQDRWLDTATALYFCALFPALGAGLLLIDLLLCAFLFIAFFILDDCFRRTKNGIIGRPSLGQSIALGLAISAGAATKGLIAGVIPALATLVTAIYLGRTQRLIHTVVSSIMRLWLAALIALAGSFLFYLFLWAAGHQDFVRSFFLVHHLGRGSAAMEGHSGPFFYHWFIVWIGGGWLIAALLRLFALAAKTRSARSQDHEDASEQAFVRASFPVAWILVTVVFFSFLATKLPNYTWPVWLAAPIAVARLAEALSHGTQPIDSPRTIGPKVLQFVAGLGGLITILAGLSLACLPALMSMTWINQSLDPRILAILSATPMHLSESIACVISGLTLALSGLFILKVTQASSMEEILKPAPGIALIYGVVMTSMLWGVMPYAKRAYHDPIAEIGKLAAMKGPHDPVFTFGLKSPTFSGAYGLQLGQSSNPNITQHGDDSLAGFERETTSEKRLLVVPPWGRYSCAEMQATIIANISFLKLCEQDFKGH